MSKVIGYIRVSTNKQDLENQKHQVLNYTNSKKMGNVEFIEIEVSSRKKDEDRRINELIDVLEENDTLVVVELSRIGRSVINVVSIVNQLVNKKINIHIIKENMIIEPNNINPFTTFQINIFSSFSQLERDLISQRTKHSLEIKKQQGIQLGRKKGQQVKSIFDEYKNTIIELLELGVTQKKIHEKIKVGTIQSLGKYVKSRKLKKKEAKFISTGSYIKIDYKLNIINDKEKEKFQSLVNKNKKEISKKLQDLINSHNTSISYDIDFTKELFEVYIKKDIIKVSLNQNPSENNVTKRVLEFFDTSKEKEFDTSSLKFNENITISSSNDDEFGLDELD
jgi:DNA invertase Pin-like site-specific DNA recombinase